MSYFIQLLFNAGFFSLELNLGHRSFSYCDGSQQTFADRNDVNLKKKKKEKAMRCCSNDLIPEISACFFASTGGWEEKKDAQWISKESLLMWQPEPCFNAQSELHS